VHDLAVLVGYREDLAEPENINRNRSAVLLSS